MYYLHTPKLMSYVYPYIIPLMEQGNTTSTIEAIF